MSYSHEWGAQCKIIFGALPLGRGQKVKYHLISITKSISKIFIPNFVCVHTNERYKTYQMGFLFCRLGHALGVGLGGTLVETKIKFCPAVCPLCYLLLNHWMKFNQIWCVGIWIDAQRKFFLLTRALGRGQYVKYHLILITKSISKIFIPNFVCSHNGKGQNILDRFFILSPGSCPRRGTWGYLRAKIKFSPAVCPLFYLLLNHWIKFNPTLVCELLTWMDRKVIFFWPRPLGPWGCVKRSNII